MRAADILLVPVLDRTGDVTLTLRRLDRLGRAGERTQRDLELISESFAIWLKLWFAHTPSIPEDAKRSARQTVESSYRQFVEHVTEQFASGRRFLDDLPREAIADGAELSAIAARAPGPSIPTTKLVHVNALERGLLEGGAMRKVFKILRALVRCEHLTRRAFQPGEVCLACGAHRPALSEPWEVPGFVAQLAAEVIGRATSGEELQTAREAIVDLLGRILDGADIRELQAFRHSLEGTAALLARTAHN